MWPRGMGTPQTEGSLPRTSQGVRAAGALLTIFSRTHALGENPEGVDGQGLRCWGRGAAGTAVLCPARLRPQALVAPGVDGLLSPYRRLARSTLLLIPLFGIHYTVFAFSPENVSKRERLVFELGLGSFQVGVVCVCVCVCREELVGSQVPGLYLVGGPKSLT